MSWAYVRSLAVISLAAPFAIAAEPGCGQSLVDGTTPPASTSYIYPRARVVPFYQWENNFGYCGEVSLIVAGLSNGQWMSQYNARLVCGTGLSQSGRNGACAAHNNQPNYNAQLLIEDPDTGVTGPGVYAAAAQCVSNSRLDGTTFNYSAEPTGIVGYQIYMSWLKAEVIAGHQVTLAVLLQGGRDPQYDHEVSVIRIGTNHSPTDASYYADDVLFFDDHGVYTLDGLKFTTNPAIPPGAGSDTTGCTPYVFGYTFGSLAQTRSGANGKSAQAYSIVIPGDQTIHVLTGGNGYNAFPIKGPHNYGFSVAGPADPEGVTLPVELALIGPTTVDGTPNPRDPVAHYRYENPMIGASVLGHSCTNTPPSEWMGNVEIHATVNRLTPGVAYNLYQYEIAEISGIGSAAALAVPTRNFNANAALASRVIHFTATASTYTTAMITTSNLTEVFRCVPASAP